MYLPGLIIFALIPPIAPAFPNHTVDADADAALSREKRDESCLRLKYRPIDGSCNNANNPRWGQTGTPYLRFVRPDYGDGRQLPRMSKSGGQLPGARVVSLHLVKDTDDEHPTYSHMLMQWGQIINHDVSKKRTSSDSCCDDGINAASNNRDCMAILLPSDDPVYSNKRCLGFTRSAFVLVDGRREQINDVTSYVDGSPVYGATEGVGRSLRSFIGGKLKSEQRPFGKELLPKKESDNTAVNSGDSRTNMIPSLVSIHVVLLRLHNRLAQDLATVNPHWEDETLFQEARRIVIAVIQHVTYSELLPAVLGENNLGSLKLQDSGYFNGYNPTVNPSVDNGFAAAAYRFGHSLVRSRFARLTNELQEVSSPLLSTEFFNVSSVSSRGEVDRILFGLLHQSSQNSDSGFTNQIHHRLFSIDGSGSDLYAINIQRGRDHGIRAYVDWRQFCGLSSPNNFQDLSGIIRQDSIAALQRAYRNVDDVDLYAAGMAEIPISGGLVGPTFACIIGRQFANLRRGDRFWYENGQQASSFRPDQLQEIRKMSLAQIVCETGEGVQRIQRNVMKVPGAGNPSVACNSLPRLNLRMWSERQEGRRENVDPSPNREFNDVVPRQQFQGSPRDNIQPSSLQNRLNRPINNRPQPQQQRLNSPESFFEFLNRGNDGQSFRFPIFRTSENNEQNSQSAFRVPGSPGNGPFGHFIRF